jgi:hypothetical protein
MMPNFGEQFFSRDLNEKMKKASSFDHDKKFPS